MRPRRNRGWISGFAAQRDGATAVEFALVAPLIIFMVIGLMEFGIFIWKKHSIEFALEETTRSVMMMSTVTEENIANNFKERLLGFDPAQVTATVSKETIGPTTFVSITASYTFEFVMVGYFGFDPIQIESKSRFPLTPPE